MPKYSQYDVPDSSQMVNLGVGQPSTKDLPLKWFQEKLVNISSSLDTPEFLQYGAIPGYDSLREKLAFWLSGKYYNNKTLVNKNQLFMTNGNTGGLQLLMDYYMESGDEIIIEDPTYFIAKEMFEQFGLNVKSVPMEDDGINVEILEETIQKIIKDDIKNLQNKIFLYIIPIHHNPTSITLSYNKRNLIARLCEKYPKLFVIADEVYHFLNFEDKIEFLPMAYYHPKIFSMGSFSKIIAPALRVGWIYQYAKDEESYDLIERLIKNSIHNSSGGTNPLGYLLIEKSIEDKSVDKLIEINRKTLSEKCNFMYDFITNQISDVEVKKPKGGYFLWLKLNIEDTKVFLDFALKMKVKFHPGFMFGKTCNNYIRLSFSYYDVEDLIIGLSRLSDALLLFKKIKISLLGFNGKLGSLIKNEISSNDKYHFVEGIRRDISINEITDVIVDVSSKEGTYNLIKYLLDNNINKPLLIGTTGLEDGTIKLIKLYSIKNPVGLISNFSSGINKVNKLLQEINKLGLDWKFSMVEKHHSNKKDSPSGTAKSFINILNRECSINSEREGDTIGFHQLKIENDDEEIIISHNAKSRSLFAKGSLNYINWIINKKQGLYFEMDIDEKPDFLMKTILGNKFIITENEDIKDKFINDKTNKNMDINFIILLKREIQKKMNNFNWEMYDLFGDKVSSNSNDVLAVIKYANEIYKINNGKIQNRNLFKYEDSKYYLELMDSPFTFTLNSSEAESLRNIIGQLSGLTVANTSKYKLNETFLIIELSENVLEIDTDILTTLGSIITGSDDIIDNYNICFVNVLEDNQTRTRYFDKNIGKESDGNAYGCVCVFDYMAFINELSYDKEIEGNIILRNEIIKVIYKDSRYFISFI